MVHCLTCRPAASYNRKFFCCWEFQSLMAKRALITGITGQDGSYLAELLLEKGYEVVGMMRRSSAANLWRIQHIVDRITLNYRESYDLFAVSGMLFNHESPRRGIEFVTRKVSDGVARIKLGLADTLSIGNLDAHRDWGFAGDYVRAMWLMLQQDRPEDFVIATGVAHSVRELIQIAFARVQLDWEKHVRVDPALLRPAEVDHLLGAASKARRQLQWTPDVDFKHLVEMMMDADVERLASPASVIR